jgi:dolichol kinase
VIMYSAWKWILPAWSASDSIRSTDNLTVPLHAVILYYP